MREDEERPAPRKIAEIDWPRWRAVDLATLCFVMRGEEVLLIRKKRGLGAGKINGPGGRLEPGETPRVCAVREVEEELCVTPTGVVARGEHRFQFVDGYSIHVYVFTADGCVGEARETAEAVPLWTPIPDIDYDEMWEDDRIWFPLLFAGTPFSGRFIFDEDAMVDYVIRHDFDASVADAVPGETRPAGR